MGSVQDGSGVRTYWLFISVGFGICMWVLTQPLLGFVALVVSLTVIESLVEEQGE